MMIPEVSKGTVDNYNQVLSDIDNYFRNIGLFENLFASYIDTDCVDLDEVFEVSLPESDEELNLNKDTEIVKRFRESLIFFLKTEWDKRK